MSTEQRLRDALHAEAARIEPSERWARIEDAIDAGPRRSPARYLPLAAAAVALLAAAVAVVTQRDDDRRPVNAGEPATTTSPVAVVEPDGSDDEPAIAVFTWPFVENSPYQTPQAVAAAFARDFLGMPDATVGEFDSTSGEIDVHPYPTGTIGSTLLVGRSDSGWVVSGAMSANLLIDSPRGGTITSPVQLRGRSVAFEGTVHVTLLATGTDLSCVTQEARACGTSDAVLANTTYTGGGTEMTPFTVDVPFTKTDAQDIAIIVLWTDSARDGSIAEATIQPVWLVPVGKV
jgi:hypothetical protein